MTDFGGIEIFGVGGRSGKKVVSVGVCGREGGLGIGLSTAAAATATIGDFLGGSRGGGSGAQSSSSCSSFRVSISVLGGLMVVYLGMSTIGTIRGVIVLETVAGVGTGCARTGVAPGICVCPEAVALVG